MYETPHAEVNKLLPILLSRIRDVLPEKLVGLYLHGSLTTGDFDLGSSDIDLLAVISSDLSDAEVEKLRAMHDAVAREHREWEDRLDVDYLSVAALRTFRTQRSPMAIITPGEPFHVTTAGRDWLMNWYLVREYGVALFGPPAAEFIKPIPREEFVQGVREYAAEWGERINVPGTRKQQAYAILTMCRALYTCTRGEHTSKGKAAVWAMGEMPEWMGLIGRALVWRERWRGEAVDHGATYAEAVRFVRFAGVRIRG